MNVIFFNSCKKWGGGEKWHSEMASAFSEKGIKVTAFADKHSRLFEAFTSSSIKVSPVSIHSLSFLNFAKTIRLAMQLKKLGADLIILNLSSDVKSAGIAAKIAGIKTIIYRRGSAIPIKNSMLNRFLFKRIITDIIANTEETKHTVRAKNPSLFSEQKIKVIHNGIKIESYKKDAKPLSFSTDKEIIFGNLARLSRQKGQKDLIEVAKFLKEKNLKFKILIGGDGELEKELKAESQKAQLNEYIVFLGFIDDVSAFFNSIDIFLFPSIWEGFGFSLIEAKLFKKPIVAYRISSNPEVVQNNVDGVLVPPNDIESFCLQALAFAQDKNKSQEFGQNGYDDVLKRFVFSNKSEELITHLRKLMIANKG